MKADAAFANIPQGMDGLVFLQNVKPLFGSTSKSSLERHYQNEDKTD
jgi:hypothetical protein